MAIEITDYSQAWPREFEAVAERLREAFGPLALRIDHIGSTSVPGLAAKDVIDVQITLASLDVPGGLEERVHAAGFVLRPDIKGDHRPPDAGGPDADWEKRFTRERDGERRMHVHFRVAGRPNQRYPLLFRDYLRTHPDAATAYERFKRGLARMLDDTNVYADLKDPVCDLVMIAAEVWAAETGWEPDTLFS